MIAFKNISLEELYIGTCCPVVAIGTPCATCTVVVLGLTATTRTAETLLESFLPLQKFKTQDDKLKRYWL
jgi:hypothetical protein